MTILLGLFLTQWYLFVGLIKSRDKKKGEDVEEDNSKDNAKDEDKKVGENEEEGELNFFKRRDDDTLLPRWQILSLSAIVTIFIISLGFLSDENFEFRGALVIFLYVMGPATFLLIKKDYSLVLTTLWVWFPIEWGLISDTIKIDIGWPLYAMETYDEYYDIFCAIYFIDRTLIPRLSGTANYVVYLG